MPAYTSEGIEYPLDSDPIQGSTADYIRTDMQRLAETANAAIANTKTIADTAYKASVATVIPVGTDWDTLTTAGTYSAPASGRSYTNTPYPNPVGSLMITDAKNSTGNIQMGFFFAASPARIFIRDRMTSGYWTGWREIAFSDPALIDYGAGRRETLVDAGIKRRGGVIGTGGLPAVALRFDHHLDAFSAKVLPLLKKYRLPWGQMINAGKMGKGDDRMSADTLQNECFASGGEIWNHSYSHSDIAGFTVADREITLGLSTLKTQFPELWVDAFAPAGQPNMMGMEGMESPEDFWNTYPGRLVLAQHAFVRGYYPGPYQYMTAPNLVGAGHVTIEKLDYTYIRGMVNGIMGSGTSVTLMLHSNFLDTTGYMSTATLEQCLKYIADQRDAGKLKVLSCAGVLVANDSVKPRSMLTASTPGAVSGAWSESASTRISPVTYGVPHEAEVWFTAASAGEVSLRVQIVHAGGSIDQVHTVTLTQGQRVRLGVVVTPPLSTTSTTVSISGSGAHEGVRYWPV